MSGSSVVLRRITRTYGGVAAVRDLDLSLDGGVIGIIGPNGAGKTTLFDLISGVTRPSSGRIELDGLDVTGLRADLIARRGVARTFQNIQLFGSLTVLENVLVPRGLHRRGPQLPWRRDAEAQLAAAHAALARGGIAELAGEPAAGLSYGSARRVEVARALAAEPTLLLLDEPLAGLTGAERGELSALFRGVADADGTTVLLVEHDVASVLASSDRVVVLDHGEVVADGPPGQVRRDPAVRAAYLGEEAE